MFETRSKAECLKHGAKLSVSGISSIFLSVSKYFLLSKAQQNMVNVSVYCFKNMVFYSLAC